MPWHLKAHVIDLAANDERQIDAVVADLLGGADHADISLVLASAAVYAQELPRSLRQRLYDFKLYQQHHALCIRTGTIDDARIGRTPERHRRAGEIEMVNCIDVRHLLFAALLGEPFGWSSIQQGYIINDVMPVREHEDRVASSGFTSKFGLHTEDAFHPWAGDYLGLLCLRNRDQVPTTFAGLDLGDLSLSTRTILFEPRFIVGANSAQNVEKVVHPSPILYGNPNDPYLRVNVNAVAPNAGDMEAQAALTELVTVLEQHAEEVVFQPGEFWYIDNLRVAHGRDQFRPRFDGYDRWLRRLYISSAFRYTRAMRDHPESRVLHPSRTQWGMQL